MQFDATLQEKNNMWVYLGRWDDSSIIGGLHLPDGGCAVATELAQTSV